jgi:carbamoyl-phosphate synthase large subunit
MKSIYIYGASGHGLVVADIAVACGYDNIIFIDDGENNYKSFEDIKSNTNIPISFGIGDNKIRKILFDKVIKNNFKVISLIHPSAIVSQSVIIGKGVVIMPNVVINAKSNIGNGVILNTACIIEHENIIEDFVHISPNVALAGNVKIGEFTHIGIGSSVIQGINIGKNNIIGGGSMVINSIEDDKKMVGVPAREINILITSAGRRVSLVKSFQETLKSITGVNYKVFTTDMNPTLSSACQISDGYINVPRVTDKQYLTILKEYCKKENISILIPTIDTELSILADAKESFKQDGIFIAISSKEICDIFYLKDTTEKFFVKNNLDTPREIEDIKYCNYPIFAKLNNSSCSIGATIVYTPEHALELAQDNNYIFQEYIKGDEYTVDVFLDKQGDVISVVPRLRIEVRAGEVNKAQAIKDKDIIKAIKELCKKLDGAYGCITIQLFKTKERIVFIEINTRFGGGYPLSYLSGANFAKYLIEDYLDEKLEYSEDWQDNLIMLRYDAEVLVDGNSI